MARRPDSPHIQPRNGNIQDFNGTGVWSLLGVQTRYRQYCDLLHVERLRLLEPREHWEGETLWIYPIMEQVIEGIEEKDAACIALGVDFVEEDDLFKFGMILKSNTARALRRTHLTEEQRERLRERVVNLLAAGIVPHEMREYSKLLRAIGVGEHWPRLERDIPRDNPFAMRFYKTLRAAEGLPD
jgi:hypothetical protein